MNWADYVIIAILLLSAIMSYFRGFVSEVLSLAIWSLALFLSLFFLSSIELLLVPVIDIPSARTIAGFAILFVLTLIVGSLVKMVFRELVEASGLSGADRIVGMVFGVARGALIVLISVVLLRWTGLVDKDQWWRESLLIPRFSALAEWSSEHTGFILDRVEKAKEKAVSIVEEAQ